MRTSFGGAGHDSARVLRRALVKRVGRQLVRTGVKAEASGARPLLRAAGGRHRHRVHIGAGPVLGVDRPIERRGEPGQARERSGVDGGPERDFGQRSGGPGRRGGGRGRRQGRERRWRFVRQPGRDIGERIGRRGRRRLQWREGARRKSPNRGRPPRCAGPWARQAAAGGVDALGSISAGALIDRRGRGLALAHVFLDLAPTLHVAAVLVERLSEDVPARAVRHEIQVLRARTDWRPPPSRLCRDWRSAPAAGPRSHRCYRASRARLRSSGSVGRACLCRRRFRRRSSESDCSRMRLPSRFRNTPATRGRSSALPVSFSTMEANVTSS